MADYPIKGAITGTVTMPQLNEPGSNYPDGFSPLPGGWYDNSQMPENRPVPIPADGRYTYTLLPVPASGDRRIMISTDFTADVENNTNMPIEVTAQCGVSAPSEDEYPMRPFVGVLHSISNVKIPPGARMNLHVIRLDVINPDILATPIPWQLVGAPKLAPQVFGPAGVWVSNAAIRVLLIG